MDIEQSESRQLLFFCLVSFLVHMGLVLWFSSYSPEFRRLTSDEFQVGLLTTEGLGETLHATLPVSTAVEKIEPEEVSQVTQSDVPPDASEAAENLISSETLPAIEQTITAPAELTEVITAETSPVPDVAPPAINQIEEKNRTHRTTTARGNRGSH